MSFGGEVVCGKLV
ncbi:hypothetical protein M2F96_22425 [Vibrio vulnificus]|nr:hypothetical protein [Vibrio vulnificus]MCU8295752.1 hypothetical protein [Vibrio vulnificus]MCU8523436.1 hypothetical protein [Vibrio vulnificus]